MQLNDGSGTEISETTLGIVDGSEACVVFLNAWAGEGGDRSELTNTEGDKLVKYVADNCNNTIVVVNTIDPRLLDQWATHENVTGILYGGPLGQSSGYAINDVLFGDVNPSGMLVHTIAKNESDYDPNTQISEASTIGFSEGNYIDYKYFDQKNLTPRYEFGFGLSYTTFTYGSKVDLAPRTQFLSTSLPRGNSLSVVVRISEISLLKSVPISPMLARSQVLRLRSCTSSSQAMLMSPCDSSAVSTRSTFNLKRLRKLASR